MPPLDLETPGFPSLERPRTPTVRPSSSGPANGVITLSGKNVRTTSGAWVTHG